MVVERYKKEGSHYDDVSKTLDGFIIFSTWLLAHTKDPTYKTVWFYMGGKKLLEGKFAFTLFIKKQFLYFFFGVSLFICCYEEGK
jgi:hypothetical protein